MKRNFRRPLVIMAPKSLLRHPEAISRLDEFTSGQFHEILEEENAPSEAQRLILCSGKVYYDLCNYRDKQGISDAAIVRIEQLYPLNEERLAVVAQQYPGARLVWCQEESQNMGAWSYIATILETIIGQRPFYAGRDASASPAVGSLALHRIELDALLKAAFTG